MGADADVQNVQTNKLRTVNMRLTAASRFVHARVHQRDLGVEGGREGVGGGGADWRDKACLSMLGAILCTGNRGWAMQVVMSAHHFRSILFHPPCGRQSSALRHDVIQREVAVVFYLLFLHGGFLGEDFQIPVVTLSWNH